MKFISTLVILVFCPLFLLSQNTLLVNKVAIDEDRYKGIKGNPYYFEAPQKAEIYLDDSEKPFEVSLNINIYSNEIEMYDGEGKYSILDLRQVRQIIIPENPVIDDLHIYHLKNQLYFKLYQGSKYQLVEKPRVSLEEIVQRPPGQIIKIKRFKRNDKLLLETKDTSEPIKAKKKTVTKVLGKSAKKLMKQTKNKMKNIADLVRLLKDLESSETK